METLYASFADKELAHGALGALLNQGVADKDLALLSDAANPGSMPGYLVAQGVPAHMALEYEKARLNGSAILSVHIAVRGPVCWEIEIILSKYQASRITLYGSAGSEIAGEAICQY